MEEKIENAVKKAEKISTNINIIMRNRLIIAILLIVDGISFITNPNSTITGMTKNIMILVILASFSSIITNVSAKTKNKKSLIISIIVMIIGIITLIFPQLISSYIQMIFALFVIYDGIMNILNTLNLNKYLNQTQKIANQLNKVTDSKKISIEFENGIEEQKEKLMNPLKNVVNKTNKFSFLYILANIIAILLGVFLVVFPDISIIVWGIIFIYTGISDLTVAARTMNLSKNIKEKKFKEILYDETK